MSFDNILDGFTKVNARLGLNMMLDMFICKVYVILMSVVPVQENTCQVKVFFVVFLMCVFISQMQFICENLKAVLCIACTSLLFF